jgi:hypothetical protein
VYSGKTLHILNGDATRDVFKRTELKDEHHLVWREMLCEGPAEEFLHDPAFWKKREEFICKHYGETPEGYFDKVIMEQIRLEAFLDDYSEIILWFEHDLFCQINLIGLLSWLSRHDMRGKIISVVSINSHSEISRFKGYGQLSPRQLHQLLPQKKELQKSDIQFAGKAWKAYADNDPRGLEHLLNEVPAAFPYLKAALLLHLQRLPFTDNGLNLIERKTLELLAVTPLTRYELMRALIEWDLNYGFTDTQFLNIIHRLKPLHDNGDLLTINSAGERVLKGTANLLDYSPDRYSVGGAGEQYRWDANVKRVIV